jgi:hypothetical protein
LHSGAISFNDACYFLFLLMLFGLPTRVSAHAAASSEEVSNAAGIKLNLNENLPFFREAAVVCSRVLRPHATVSIVCSEPFNAIQT